MELGSCFLTDFFCFHLDFYTSAVIFFICVRIFIVVPCPLHLSTFLLFSLSKIPVSRLIIHIFFSLEQLPFDDSLLLISHTHFVCLPANAARLILIVVKCLAFLGDRLGWPAKCFCSNDSFCLSIFFKHSSITKCLLP